MAIYFLKSALILIAMIPIKLLNEAVLDWDRFMKKFKSLIKHITILLGWNLTSRLFIVKEEIGLKYILDFKSVG